MLVPQPGDSTNSQSEKKELDDKQKMEGIMMSPHYDIPVKNAVKRHLEFTQAINLRKQHTTTNVQNNGKGGGCGELTLSKKNSIRMNERGVATQKTGAAAATSGSGNAQNIYSLPVKPAELADHQIISPMLFL